jgi:uncharacterized membrane protein
MRYELKNEFVVIWGVSVILILVAGFTELQTLRIALGLPFVLLFPGYTLVAALFPGREGLSGLERLMLSLGLSVIIVALGGLILNYIWGIHPHTVFTCLFLFITAMSVLGWCRRRRLLPHERFYIVFHLSPGILSARSCPDRALVLAVAGAFIFALGSLAYVWSASGVGERFTEFYILGTSGRADDYPRVVRPGEVSHLILGIGNHEHQASVYRVDCRINGRLEWRLGPIRLGHNERDERLVSFSARSEPGEMKVEFYLYRQGEADFIRILHLWVTVVEPEKVDKL